MLKDRTLIKPLRLSLIAVLALNALPAASEPACRASTGAGTAALIELYTSEGCDSCPPADAWLSQAMRDELKPGQAVALAFHVDYWNYLGWADPFSQPYFSERQREAARRAQSRTVFTPQVLLQSENFRWSRANFTNAVTAVNAKPAAAALSLELTARQGKGLQANVTAQAVDATLARTGELYLALYENNLETQVRAGENRGRTLRHDFVVRKLVGPIGFNGQGSLRRQETFALDTSWKASRLGVAAFVQDRNSGHARQALALNACNRL